MADRQVRKILSYRDQSGASQAAHRAHWEGFTWRTGPVIVASVGPWGCCQVWAASESEGKRVVRHAAAIGGWDPDDPSRGRWIVRTTSNSRYGRRATVGVKVRRGVPWISKRDGPSGAPTRD
jgi:hypothetical protein